MTVGFSTHSNHLAPSSLLSHAICYIAVGPIELLSSDDEEFSTNSTWTVSHSRIGWYSKNFIPEVAVYRFFQSFLSYNNNNILYPFGLYVLLYQNRFFPKYPCPEKLSKIFNCQKIPYCQINPLILYYPTA